MMKQETEIKKLKLSIFAQIRLVMNTNIWAWLQSGIKLAQGYCPHF